MEEGVSWEVYDPVDAIELCWSRADSRLTEEKGPRSYKKRATKRKLKTLSDSSDMEDDDESEFTQA